MEKRLSMITLGVADLKRAVAFYEKVIGWKANPSPSEIAFFDLGGVVFSLYPHDNLAKDMNAAADDNGDLAYQGFALAHNARSKEEVDLIFSRLKGQQKCASVRADWRADLSLRGPSRSINVTRAML